MLVDESLAVSGKGLSAVVWEELLEGKLSQARPFLGEPSN
jgi:hypothetical protein